MPPSRKLPSNLLLNVVVLALPLVMASCSSSGSKVKGVPANLPVIPLHGTAATPAHSMSHQDYPFDPSGNYVTAWAAEGETRAGRGAAGDSDYSNWKQSHSGASSSRSSSTAKRKTTSSKPKSKSSTAKKKSSSVRHTVRSGDTLSGIARKYGSSVSRIKSANGLRSDLIRNGQTLTVPR